MEILRSKLVGRTQQVQDITGYLDSDTVEGRALLLVGDAGLGKTALLGEIAEARAAGGHRVLSAAGVQFEAELAYAGLHQLLFPLHEQFAAMEDAHRDALRTALGFGGGAPPDRLVVSNAVLVLLRQAAARQPVFIVVDDFHWLDRASAAVLAFVARRVAGARIGFIAATRTGVDTDLENAGLPVYELPPLDAAAAADLVRDRFPDLGERARERILAQAQGNPLALLELPSALSGPQRADLVGLPEVLPLSERLGSLYSARIRALPPATRRSLLLLALDGTGDLAVLQAAAGGADQRDALAPAESHRLVTIDEKRRCAVFRHPLIGSAVVAGSTLDEQCDVHLALADVPGRNPERQAWHLGQATLEPDEEVAALLEEAAGRVSLRGDAARAIAILARAAELSPDQADMGRRLAKAAYIGADASGELPAASALLESARRAHPDPAGSLLAAAAAVHLLLNNGDGDVDTAYRLLVGAIEAHARVGGAETGRGLDAQDSALTEALHTLALVCCYSGRSEMWETFHAACRRLDPAPHPLLRAVSLTFADPVRTGTAGLPVLEAVLAALHDDEDPGQIIRAGTASLYLDRLGEVREPTWRVLRQGRGGGPARRSIGALMHLCIDDYLTGRWDEMDKLAAEGLRICDDHDYRFFRWYFHYNQAMLAAARGHFETSRALADRITAWAVPRGAFGALAFADEARVRAALGEGNFESAYQHAVAISPAGIFASHVPHALRVVLDLVEAAVRTGRQAAAEAHVQAMRDAGLAALSPRLAILTEACAALVAPDEGAVEHFERALALPGCARWPFDRARVQLAYGERLRRTRSLTEARAQLDAANEAFERLGARPWAARAVGELRATRPPGAGAAPGSLRLTAQELEIAQLAASGLSNKQIAERLYISHRTVGAHLYQVFPKLGISSRAALRDALEKLSQHPAR